MKLRKKAKGFTIIELVIVIAVIAVLAAVLIPTFINLTAKANKAADESLVNSLNKALAIEEVDNEVNNMHDAVEALKREGYNASVLVTKSDQDLLYDLDNNRFLLENQKKDGVPDYKYWTVADSMPSVQKYSIYATDDFSNAEVNGLKVGFDAGDCSSITNISYVGTTTAQNVIVRTNGGRLTVDAPNDTLNHFGDGVVLDVNAIGGDSYHEFGYFPKASVKQGRIVVEEKGEIQVLDVSGATAAVKVEKAGHGEIKNIVKGDNANVVVADNLTPNIATMTTVNTWAALKTEVESGTNKVIKFEPTAEQTNAATISISRSVTVLGNNTLVSGSNDRQGVPYNWQYNGLINVTGTGIVIGLDSMNLQAYKVNSNNARAAVNLCSGQNDITISNSTLTGQYAICTNITGADSNKLTLNDVKFGNSTYCSVYWRASGGTVVANRTNFSSVNTASNSQENGFGTIVIEFAKKNGVHDQLVDNKMENNTFTLNNCTITNVELGTAVQCVVAVYSPYNNIVNFNNCNYGASNDLIVLGKGQIWNPAANSSTLLTTEFEIDRPAKPSKLYIDGKDADNNLNVLHAAVRDCCIPMIGGKTNCTFAHDGCDYLPLYGYERVDNGNGTWTYQKSN